MKPMIGYAPKSFADTLSSFADAITHGVDAVSFKLSTQDEHRVCLLRELLTYAEDARPNLSFLIEIENATVEAADRTVSLMKEYGVLDRTYISCLNGEILGYLKRVHQVHTVGAPDFQMECFTRGDYRYYDAIALSADVVRSPIFDLYSAKNLPMHMYADDETDVALCIENGATLICTSDPAMLMKYRASLDK